MTIHRMSMSLALATALGVLGLGWATTTHALELSSQRLQAHLMAVATATADPGGTTLMARGQCPDQTTLVRCLYSPQDADTLAQHYLAALSRAYGRPATGTCEPLPVGGTRTCTVRVDAGEHAVLISVDPVVDWSSGRRELNGSRVRLDAD